MGQALGLAADYLKHLIIIPVVWSPALVSLTQASHHSLHARAAFPSRLSRRMCSRCAYVHRAHADLSHAMLAFQVISTSPNFAPNAPPTRHSMSPTNPPTRPPTAGTQRTGSGQDMHAGDQVRRSSVFPTPSSMRQQGPWNHHLASVSDASFLVQFVHVEAGYLVGIEIYKYR